MKLQWKSHHQGENIDSNVLMEMNIQTLSFVVRDLPRGTFRFGNLLEESRPDTLQSQIRYLLKQFKEEGSSRDDLEFIGIGKNRFKDQMEELRSALEPLGIRFKSKLFPDESPAQMKMSFQTGEVWVKKLESNEKKLKKVLIIEDSQSVQKILEKIYSEIPNVEIVGIESSVEGAVKALREKNVDFVSLDMYLEGGTGLEVLKQSGFKSLSKNKNVHCVLVTDCSDSEGSLVFDAMAEGATHYFRKPAATNLKTFQRELSDLLQEIFYTSTGERKPEIRTESKKSSRKEKILLNEKDLIAIGSSTGGTEIVAQLVAELPREAPPIVVVQHMPPQFTDLYAKRLARQTGRPTIEVSERMELQQGHAYIAAGGRHMVVRSRGQKLFVEPLEGEPVNRFMPSVSVLFESVFQNNLATKTVAIMLTGMGSDGSKEMLELKNRGSLTIGQSEESCSVYGMPRAAQELGALCYSMSPEEMIRSMVMERKSRNAAS
ncbi:MAG: hypothetical protein CL676_09605 [Bdellovibrionaceae bacterium]|nr:hypothetical protein [Pseudobdellovibrionaceae bacterium]|tara:strand:+ start:3171 stop:4637 length:1467 start_codon:yes stop_codon:yes gene_type:complete